MGHEAPRTEAERNPIPSIKWPLIWIFTAGYIVVASFIDFTVGIDSKDDAINAMYCFPLACIGLVFAIRFLLKRLKQRQQWRNEKFIMWLKKPLPAPRVTDWVAFERRTEREVAIDELAPARTGDQR